MLGEEEEEEDEVDVLTKNEWRLLSSDDETDTVNVLQYMPVVSKMGWLKYRATTLLVLHVIDMS